MNYLKCIIRAGALSRGQGVKVINMDQQAYYNIDFRFLRWIYIKSIEVLKNNALN